MACRSFRLHRSSSQIILPSLMCWRQVQHIKEVWLRARKNSASSLRACFICEVSTLTKSVPLHSLQKKSIDLFCRFVPIHYLCNRRVTQIGKMSLLTSVKALKALTNVIRASWQGKPPHPRGRGSAPPRLRLPIPMAARCLRSQINHH
jgi:hypothetical protein